MNPNEDEIAELENKIKEKDALILDLNIENHKDKVKLKKLKREAEINDA